MAYFASVENNIVDNIIVVDDNDCLNYLGNFSEEIGAEFCARNINSNKVWVHTRKDGSIRANSASIGCTYDSINDVFVPKKIYQSWTLNTETYKWEAPLAEPELTQEQRDQNYLYVWSEELYASDNTQGWLLIPHNT